MGQVPPKNLNGSKNGPAIVHNASSVLIIGSGNLAKHLNHYFRLLSKVPHSWHRGESVESLNALLNQATTVALAISDDALADFRADFLNHFTGKIIHFSGAKNVENTICCHPLYTFSKELYDLETYKKIPFAVTGANSLQNVFEFLPNPFFSILESQKALYHACAVSSGNFINLLIQHTFSLLKSNLMVDAKHFEPFLNQSLANAIANPGSSLTGPFVRRDVETIRTHLEVLENSPLHEIYRSFLSTYDHQLLALVDKKESL